MDIVPQWVRRKNRPPHPLIDLSGGRPETWILWDRSIFHEMAKLPAVAGHPGTRAACTREADCRESPKANNPMVAPSRSTVLANCLVGVLVEPLCKCLYVDAECLGRSSLVASEPIERPRGVALL